METTTTEIKKRGRKHLAPGEKKKALSIFVKLKDYDNAKIEVKEIERKYNSTQDN